MTQFPHDQFVKEYLPQLLGQYGEVRAAETVSSERREIDVFFQPHHPVPTTPETLGLLGRLAQQSCLFEAFRNPVVEMQIKGCLNKLLDVQLAKERDRHRHRENLKVSVGSLPCLWILSPTVSGKILAAFKAEPKESFGSQGIYFLPDALQTGIIVIHQLPVTLETLWLRLLGRGSIQENAIAELKSLPLEHPLRTNALELVYGLLSMLQFKQQKREKLDKADQELLMKLATFYKEQVAQEVAQGRKQGLEQGLEQGKNQEVALICRLLTRKIGEISPELQTKISNLSFQSLEDLGEALLDFQDMNDLVTWLAHLT
ncbi:MAG: DUF4351 domain-containing protein [Snowella sp.]|nr:DUF4351 domain-containing protein [Snowella sp.]